MEKAQQQRVMERPLQRGYTIIELGIALAIGALLLAVALPTFQNIITENRTATITNELLTGLTLARSEAITRGHRVVICASSDGATCGGALTEQDWHEGWIIFPDPNANGTQDAGEEVISASESSVPLDLTIELTESPGPSLSTTSLAFTRSGRARQATSGAPYEGTFVVTHQVSRDRLIRLNPTGRAQAIRCVGLADPDPLCPAP